MKFNKHFTAFLSILYRVKKREFDLEQAKQK